MMFHHSAFGLFLSALSLMTDVPETLECSLSSRGLVHIHDRGKKLGLSRHLDSSLLRRMEAAETSDSLSISASTCLVLQKLQAASGICERWYMYLIGYTKFCCFLCDWDSRAKANNKAKPRWPGG
ncbi:unnamed protein product [Euphydryas editha]|uniref:Secreted protein n=1 Tax=Euphydryas editha TaxID=104508 RepID=A0AAU9TX65_EUPED|nr:unnamed protein product [Euphydryas editha]